MPMDTMPQEQPMDPTAMGPTAGDTPNDMNPTAIDPTAGETPNDMEMGGDNMDAGNGDGDEKKKEIQQLAGKLSELLHTYNEENGDDEELNKYVKGMIDAQTDGDSNSEDSDFDEDDEDVDMDMNDEDMDMNDEDADSPEEMPNENPEKKMKESRTVTKRQLKEEFGELIKRKHDEEIRLNKKINKNNTNPKNPFIPPKFN